MENWFCSYLRELGNYVAAYFSPRMLCEIWTLKCFIRCLNQPQICCSIGFFLSFTRQASLVAIICVMVVMCFCCIFDSLSCLSDKSVRSTSILDSKHILMFVHFSYPFQPHHQPNVGFQNSLTCLGGGMSLVTTVSTNVLAAA